MGCGAAVKKKYALDEDVREVPPIERLRAMKLQELKSLLAENDIPAEGCLEKNDLVEALVTNLGADAAVAAADKRLFIPEKREGGAPVQADANQKDLPQLAWRQEASSNDEPAQITRWNGRTSGSVQNSAASAERSRNDRPDSIDDARRVLKLLEELQIASDRLERVLTSEAEALDKRRKAQSAACGKIRGSVVGYEDVQVAQDRAVAIGMLTKDSQHEEARLRGLIREVEMGAMRLCDVQLPELVGLILEQLQGVLADIRAANQSSPPRCPPPLPPPPPPPLRLQGQISELGRLHQELAVQEEASRLRVLALTDG